jgi:UDP-N-acetylmuramyl pentapeptide phosphotransferase/UDP-N-acetylglucosamine-1-phosphate transferase
MAIASNWQVAPALLALAAACVSALMIVALQPLLVRYALARPNARSSHVVPTPQGGGIAVIIATFVVAIPALLFLAPSDAQSLPLWTLLVAAAFLCVIGAIDDIQTIEALPRLILQFIAVGTVVALLPTDIHAIPALPLWIERVALTLGGVWFVNLTNFMDGIDWMTVTEVVAITVGVLLLALIGVMPLAPGIIGVALLGAIVGFAPFNRPVARLFLGDVGSLPIGLILFWLMVQLAGRGYLAAALLLPLYYLADATITLAARIARRESIMQAHRGHFYQRATNVGFSVPAIIARVAFINVLLVGLALTSAWAKNAAIDIAMLAIGAAAVALLLRHLTQEQH